MVSTMKANISTGFYIKLWLCNTCAFFKLPNINRVSEEGKLFVEFVQRFDDGVLEGSVAHLKKQDRPRGFLNHYLIVV